MKELMKQLCDLEESMKLTGKSRTTLHRLVEKGKLTPVRIGAARFYKRSEILKIKQTLKK